MIQSEHATGVLQETSVKTSSDRSIPPGQDSSMTFRTNPTKEMSGPCRGPWVGCRACSTKKGLACRNLTREPSVLGKNRVLTIPECRPLTAVRRLKTPKQEARRASNAKKKHHRRKGSAPGCCNCQSGSSQPNKRRAPRVAGAG